MIDELELAFDDDAERRRARHRRRHGATRGGQAAAQGGKGRGRSFFALLLTLILLAVLGAGGWFGITKVRDYFSVKDYSGPGDGSATVRVVSGDTSTDIANNLYKTGVVKSAKAFVSAAQGNAKSKTIQAGYYKLRLHMKASAALDALLATDTNGALANKVSSKVTITEGMISVDVFAALSKATNIPVADFQNLAKNPVALGIPDWWFTRQDSKQAVKSMEGFLYPATYEFEPGSDATTILKAIVKNFTDEMTKLDFANQVQHNLNISPYEALVAASIAQVEATAPTDMAGVSRVIYNRAYTGKFPCSCLGLDSEVNYWLRISGKKATDSGNLTVSQLHDPNDPYNTHDKPGLPIGPISNPGADALTGAMNPPKGAFNNYFYFLTVDKQGKTAFAGNAAQFEQIRQQACRNGINIC
jgi:UPF0755 protein